MYYHFTEVSRNRKVGPIPVVTSSRSTCPPSCPLAGNGGCYAEGGPLRLFWDAVSKGEKGISLDELCARIRRLPRYQLWRYGQAGDLPGDGEEIDAEGLFKLVNANGRRPVLAYTHKDPYFGQNLSLLKEAQTGGFSVNLSADNLEEADELSATGLNVVVVLPTAYARKSRAGEWTETLTEYRDRTRKLPKYTPGGHRIAVCPATYSDVRCVDCGACATFGRRAAIIGFPAHGSRKYQVDSMLKTGTKREHLSHQ